MSDRRKIASQVGAVEDPLLRRSLKSLGMLGSMDGGSVKVRLPGPNYPLIDQLTARVRDAGATDVVFEEMADEDRAAIAGVLQSAGGPRIGEAGSSTRVIVVSSGKGGVGKSSVAANLAVALARTGKRVGVIDADIWGFSIPRMLGIDYPPVVIEQMIIPPIAHGVQVISMDYFVSDDQAVIWRGPMLHKAIEQFLSDVWWDRLDYLLVDTPPGTGDVSISISQLVPRVQVLLVTTPQPTAERVARRAGLMAAKVDQEVIGVVENMSWFTGDDGKRYELFGRGGGEELANEQGLPLLAQIPFLPDLRQGADEGRVAEDGSEAGEAFRGLADAVIARKPRLISHPELVIH